MITKHLRIHGKVQGVGYRAWIIQTATKLNVNGWVRNRNDGTVEAVTSGSPENIERLIEYCYEGPMTARVSHIDIRDAQPEHFQGFVHKETI